MFIKNEFKLELEGFRLDPKMSLDQNLKGLMQMMKDWNSKVSFFMKDWKKKT